MILIGVSLFESFNHSIVRNHFTKRNKVLFDNYIQFSNLFNLLYYLIKNLFKPKTIIIRDSRLLFLSFFKFFFNYKLIFDIRGIFWVERKNFKTNELLYSFSDKYLLKYIDCFFFVTPVLRREFFKNFKIQNKNYLILPSLPFKKRLNKIQIKNYEFDYLFLLLGPDKWQNIKESFENVKLLFPNQTKVVISKNKIHNGDCKFKFYFNLNYPDVIKLYKNYDNACGYIYRDENIINKVASPVKIPEFLENLNYCFIIKNESFIFRALNKISKKNFKKNFIVTSNDILNKKLYYENFVNKVKSKVYNF